MWFASNPARAGPRAGSSKEAAPRAGSRRSEADAELDAEDEASGEDDARYGPWASFRPVVRHQPLDPLAGGPAEPQPLEAPLRFSVQALLRRRLLECLDGARPERSQEVLALMHSLGICPSAAGLLGLLLTLPHERALQLYDQHMLAADPVTAARGLVFLLHNLIRRGQWPTAQARMPAPDDPRLALAEPFGPLLLEALLGVNKMQLAARYVPPLIPQAGRHAWRLQARLAGAAARNNCFREAHDHLQAMLTEVPAAQLAQPWVWFTVEMVLGAAIRLHQLEAAVGLTRQARELAAGLRVRGLAASAALLVAQTADLANRLGRLPAVAHTLVQPSPALEDIDALLAVLRRDRVSASFFQRHVLPWLGPLAPLPPDQLLQRFLTGTLLLREDYTAPHAARTSVQL